MDSFLQILNRIFNLNLSKQQLFLKADKFFFKSKFKVLLVATFFCFVFLCCLFQPIVVIDETFRYGSLSSITYKSVLFKVPVYFLAFAKILAIQFWTVKHFISLALLIFIFLFSLLFLK